MAIYSPLPTSLEQLLRTRRFIVPIYQRQFSWTEEEASALWHDIEKNKPPYFLGVLVLQKTDKNDTFQVVDGQQRLATLLLLIRSAVEALGIDDDDAKLIRHDYINQKRVGEKESELVLVLNERDKYNFSSLIDEVTHFAPLLSPRDRKINQRPASPAKLNSVKDFFLDRFKELMNEKGREGIIEFITKTVLAITFIEVQLENDNDVFLFFETLNARGIDLTIADLLKNRVCNVARDKSGAANRIDDITDLISVGKMNSFLLHYCIALADEKEPPTKKKLMSWYNLTIEDEKDKFLDSLRYYADIYSIFLDPSKGKSNEIKETLNNLKVLGATRCYPLLLVGYKYLTTREFTRLCKAVEILTFRHSTISGKDAKTLEDEYYKMSQIIKRGDKLETVLTRLRELSLTISSDLFEANFKEYEPANNLVARYILFKVDNNLNKSSIKLSWDDCTLEHILAGGADWDGKDVLAGRLGNMTLLSGEKNKSVGIKSFKEKKKSYKFENRSTLTQKLLEYEDFTKDDIPTRQAYLASLASDVWNPQ